MDARKALGHHSTTPVHDMRMQKLPVGENGWEYVIHCDTCDWKHGPYASEKAANIVGDQHERNEL